MVIHRIAKTASSLFCALILGLGLWFMVSFPAIAATQLEESPGQWLYRSQQTLQDQTGHSWQVILFKRIKDGKTTDLELRLVGFPGVAEFNHPQPLKVIAGADEVVAPDVFAEQAPSPNVGQYNLSDAVDRLTKSRNVMLDVPLKNQSAFSLKIPVAIVEDWQKVLTNQA